jgi:hypothetical protein
VKDNDFYEVPVCSRHVRNGRFQWFHDERYPRRVQPGGLRPVPDAKELARFAREVCQNRGLHPFGVHDEITVVVQPGSMPVWIRLEQETRGKKPRIGANKR